MTYHFWNKETFEFTESLDVKPGRTPANGTLLPLPNLAGFDEPNTGNPSPEGKGKIVWNNDNWLVLSAKEFTEHLISIGHKSKSDFEKVDELGEIVAMSRVELIESGIITKEQVLTEKLAEISQKAKSKIEGGFRSKAKSGQWYIYDSELEDQFNLQSLAASGVDSLYRCRKESDGLKDFYPHTNTQLNQIVSEFAQFKLGALAKAHELRTALNTLATALDVENFVVAF